jgi:hypothetical protein
MGYATPIAAHTFNIKTFPVCGARLTELSIKITLAAEGTWSKRSCTTCYRQQCTADRDRPTRDVYNVHRVIGPDGLRYVIIEI